ncbi:MAG: glycosyltransferase [Bacteroidales bacterium]|nr:glycosyltransferase [Bacteroidales bacterium]
MAKVLVLSTHDHHYGGHGWSIAENLKKSHEVCFICGFRKNKDTSLYFFDATKKIGLASFVWRALPYFTCLLTGKRPDIHSFVSSHLFGVSAKSILSKCSFIPDYIILPWTANFLKEKTIYDLQKLSGAEIIFSFTDEAYLASCHYPADCVGWKTGCFHCPALRYNKWLATRTMRLKSKYWTGLNAKIICSPYDAELIKESPFLNNKKVIPILSVPKIPYYYSKAEARSFFGIDEEDFVIFAGANSFKGRRKGMSVLSSAMSIIAEGLENKSIRTNRRITLLLVGNGTDKVEFDSRINTVRREFLPLEHFFKAFYACDLHVSPSLADSGPMMVNYSFACRRPVVAFPIGYAATLVKNGETGYLAEYGSKEDIAKCIIKFFDLDESVLRKMGDNCWDYLNEFNTSEPFIP